MMTDKKAVGVEFCVHNAKLYVHNFRCHVKYNVKHNL